MKSAPAAALSAAMLLALAMPARAEDLEQAKMYFNAGAQAYSAGRYAFAVQAFEQAYKLAPRPAIAFSLAQAERKQFFVAKHNDVLAHAVKHYHEYLDQVPTGGRRDDAVNALAELEPLAARVSPETVQSNAPAAVETRIMVSSQTEHANGSIDGGAMKDIPFMAD